MNKEQRPSPRKDRQPAELNELLHELEACGHHGVRLLERSGLPFWGRGLLFRLMGYVAKADGRVTELDIRYAEAIMRVMKSPPRQRRRLIRLFHAGKQDHQPFAPLWFRLITLRWPGTALRIGMTLGHLCHHDGQTSAPRTARCRTSITDLGLSREIGNRILGSYRSKVWITSPNAADEEPRSAFENACQILGGKPADSLESLRQAYRRKRSLYHPDRVAHSDIDPDLARVRLDELHKAWDLVSNRHPDA